MAARHPGLGVHRHHRGYDGHVLVRAIRRFARRALAGEQLVFGTDCPDTTCHRVLIAEWTNELATHGLYHRVPHPFPDPEVKTRPRDAYKAASILKYMACLDEDAGYEDAFVW